MVAEGTGLAFLPSGLKVENEQIRYVSLTPKVYRYQVVIYQEEMSQNPKMTDFIDLLWIDLFRHFFLKHALAFSTNSALLI